MTPTRHRPAPIAESIDHRKLFGLCEVHRAQSLPNPPPPSFPRRRESIPGKVHRNAPPEAACHAARSNQVVNLGTVQSLTHTERPCYYSFHAQTDHIPHSVLRPPPRQESALCGTVTLARPPRGAGGAFPLWAPRKACLILSRRCLIPSCRCLIQSCSCRPLPRKPKLNETI